MSNFGDRAHEERLDEQAAARLWSLLELGDPAGEVAIAYRVKERLRDLYRTRDPDEARRLLEELKTHCLKKAMPLEEALNNLVKRIERIGFGFRNFENYRVRALLYAGRPNWRVLGSIVVR